MVGIAVMVGFGETVLVISTVAVAGTVVWVNFGKTVLVDSTVACVVGVL